MADGDSTGVRGSLRLSRRLLAVGGVALLALGQVLLVWLPEIRLVPSWLSQAVTPVWPDAAPVLVAIAVFLVGCVLLQFGVQDRSDGWERSSPPFRFATSRRRRGAAVLAVAAAASFTLLVTRLSANGNAAPLYVLFWIATGLAVAAAIVLDGPRSRRVQAGTSAAWLPPLLEAVVVVGAVGMFAYAVIGDAGNWYYSAIGDEYNFYDAAAACALGHGPPNLFSQQGAYDIIPVASSALCGMFMRVFGQDAVGWKISAAMPVVVTLVLLFILARFLWGRAIALVALCLFAGSHYLMAYTHTGYPNMEAVLPAVAAVLAFAVGVRRGQRAWLLVGGMAAGAGWYTYYTARAAIAILGAATALAVPRREWARVGAWILAGFIVVTTPIVVVSGGSIVAAMLEQTGVGTTSEPAANRELLPLWNAGRSLLAFNYNTHDGPYLHGSLAEPVTAVCFVAGLAVAISTWRDLRSRLILAWYTIGIFTAGVASKYDYVSVSRLTFLIPVVSLCAAVGLIRMVAVLGAAAGVSHDSARGTTRSRRSRSDDFKPLPLLGADSCHGALDRGRRGCPRCNESGLQCRCTPPTHRGSRDQRSSLPGLPGDAARPPAPVGALLGAEGMARHGSGPLHGLPVTAGPRDGGTGRRPGEAMEGAQAGDRDGPHRPGKDVGLLPAPPPLDCRRRNAPARTSGDPGPDSTE